MRPKAPQRISTTGDLTVLEKIWGKLFTENGESTPRLGQFLRGVAVYLIEAYEPTYSLVITPPKLQKFYQDTKVTNEIYPWQVVFDDRTSSISRMLREVEAQHHLVQEKLDGRPDIPGLTPQGFETWATLLIKAHPEQEFERLAKVAMDMPIDNPDERKERFPKELTRRLFPKQTDNAVAAKLQKAMSVHCNVTFKTRTESTAGAERDDNATPQSVPRSTQDSVNKTEPVITPVTSHSSSNSARDYQRDTKPQSFSSDADALFDSEEENAPTPQPIERQRQPYVAQPGGGKHYDSVDINSTSAEVRPAASTSDFRPPPTQDARLGRSMSMRSNGVERPRPAPISLHQPAGTAPIEIPESRHHRASAYRREGPVGSAPRRTRSPSMSKENAASSSRIDANDLYGHLSQSAGPNIDTFSGIGNERDRRYRDYESARRERFPEDRYDAARMAAYDPRERDRDRERVDKGFIPERADMRQRGQSVAVGLGVDSGREEEYYRNSGAYPPPPGQPHSAGFGYERPRERERDIPIRDATHGVYQGGGMSQTAGGHYPPNAYRDVR